MKSKVQEMSVVESFADPQENMLVREFFEQGYVIRDVAGLELLDSLRHAVVEIACQFLGISLPEDEQFFLDHVHEDVSAEKMNDLRLAIYHQMNNFSWFRPTYFALGKSLIQTLVGNELAMQYKINFSIQMPKDESSLLGVHADAWSGESPFQIVQWLPLVDVYQTKSMYILPPTINRRIAPKLKEIVKDQGTNHLYETHKEDFIRLSIPYGKVLIFSPTLLHGNVINEEKTTRWSLNCRYKGLFTPYTSLEKSLGNFYLPITMRVASRIGIHYKSPEGFVGASYE